MWMLLAILAVNFRNLTHTLSGPRSEGKRVRRQGKPGTEQSVSIWQTKCKEDEYQGVGDENENATFF